MRKGLSHKFYLVKGKFNLTESYEKANDNLSFFATFFDFFRVYLQDYCFQASALLQKPESFLFATKTRILYSLQSSINVYVGGMQVDKIDLVKTDTKDFLILVENSYTDKEADNTLTNKTVIFYG